MSDFSLTRHERTGELWKKLHEHIGARIEALRTELEKPANDAERTASLRGKIAVLREIQALERAPERPPAGEPPGDD